jgi:hypothetical protein
VLAFKSTDISVEDLSLYFASTQVRVHENNKPPRWLQFLAAKNGGLYFSDGKDDVVMKREAGVVLEQRFPVGFFNTKDSVLYGYRVPARNVTKGINGHNYKLLRIESILKDNGFFAVDSQPLKEILQYLTLKKVLYTPDLFGSIFENPKYFKISEAYVAIKGRKAFSRALSPNFALVPHPHNKDFLIFRHERPVAELVSKNKIKILIEEFRQECLEFFPTQGATIV